MVSGLAYLFLCPCVSTVTVCHRDYYVTGETISHTFEGNNLVPGSLFGVSGSEIGSGPALTVLVLLVLAL